jgi:hypothetical protein
MRRLRASLDTGGREPTELSQQEMPLNAVEQGWDRRQDAGSADQSGAQPGGEAEAMTPPGD